MGIISLDFDPKRIESRENDMIGIIILNFNTPYETIKCIDSILLHTRSSFHIFLVDNKSTDNSIDIFNSNLSNYSNMLFLPLSENAGYSKGNNEGIKAALNFGCTEFVIINSDVILKNDAIDIMLKKIIDNGKIKVVGPSVLSIDNFETQKLMKPLNFRRIMLNFRPFSFLEFLNDRFVNFSGDIDYIFQGMVYGCCFMFTKDILVNGKLFDERMFLYYEEDALAYQFVKKGFESCFASKAKVMHLHSASISKKTNLFESFHRYLSALYVLKKYSDASEIQVYIFSIYILIVMFYKEVLGNKDKIEFNNFKAINHKILRNQDFIQIQESRK